MITTEILNMIGNEWVKPGSGQIRYYVNDWKDLIGMEVEYYNTGNVCDVRYDGRNPSNCWFKKYVQSTKVWVDVEGGVHVDYCRDEYVEEHIIRVVTERIERLVAESMPAETMTETTEEVAVTVEAEAACTSATTTAIPAEQEWEFDDCRVIRDDDRLKVIMDGIDGYRMMEVLSGDNIEEDVARLDAGESPVGLWEDGNGNVVCYDAGSLCDEDGEPVVDIIFEWNGQDYRIRMPDVGEDIWASIARHDETEHDELFDHLSEEDIVSVNGEDYHGHAQIIDSWDDVDDYPDESMEEFIGPMFAQETPDDLVEGCGGDIAKAADEWTAFWFEGSDPQCDANRQRLRQQYGMNPKGMRQWMAAWLKTQVSPRTVMAILKVAANGNGLMISCTKEIRALGLDRGDVVKVTFERI